MSPPESPVGPREPVRAVDKGPDAFRTISEVADELDLPQHVLRFWETRFPQIKPLKRGGGRRYYRPDDVDLLKGIRHLLYGEGYTIKGVQRILKEDGIRFVQAIGRGEESVEAPPAGPDETGPAASGRADQAAGGLRQAESAPVAPPLRSEALSRAAGSAPSGQDVDLARLRAVLEELLECERVLLALKTPPSQEDEVPPR
jgi:DNA-binding transcriptional MerR regulator